MRKIWLISILAFAFLPMVACATTPKGERVLRARGTVAAYEPGKMISLRAGMGDMEYMEQASITGEYKPAPPVPQPVLFSISSDTEVHAGIKPGIRVLIRYTQVGQGDSAARTAVSIDAVWEK